MCNNQESTYSKDATIAQLREQLVQNDRKISNMATQRDNAIRTAAAKDQEIKSMKLKLGGSEKKKDLVDSLKLKIGELKEKLLKKNEEVKEKNEIIEKMRMAIKKATKENEEKIQKVKEEMNAKVQSMEQSFEEKLKDLEQSESDTTSESSVDSGFSASSGVSTPEPTNDFEFFTKLETTQTLADQLVETANEVCFLKSTLEMQNNWIESFLHQNASLISKVLINNQSIMMKNEENIKLLEDQVQKAKEVQNNIHRDVEMENLKLRLRDIEFLESLL